MKESAAKSFIAHKDVDILFVTKDKQCFFNEHDGRQHAKHISANTEDRKVTIIKRMDCADEIEALTTDSSSGAGETLIDKINACETVEAVDALIKKNSPKAAKEAAEAKKISLGSK